MATAALAWMPGVLRAAGLPCYEIVTERYNWLEAGLKEHGPFGVPRGVMLHHTACCTAGAMPDIDVLEYGRPDNRGPECNLGLDRDGRFRAICANKAWHAGYGWWPQTGPNIIHDGNGCFIGIEMENAGNGVEKWSPLMRDAALRGTAALLKQIGAPASMCCGHKEYARTGIGQLGRKIDPIDWDMEQFRSDLVKLLSQPIV